MKTTITALIATMLTASFAWAIQVQDVNSVVLGDASQIKCSTGVHCVMTGKKVSVDISGGAGSFTTVNASGIMTPTGGVVASGQAASPFTTFATWPTPTLTSGTSTTPSATTVYLSQIYIPFNVTLTGIAINNAGTVGTNKYVVALFNASGTPLANSALAGVLTSGASSWQKVPFSGTLAVVGPGIYWVGLYVDGVTDRFYTIPAVGAFKGLNGSVTGQTFGTVAAVTLPTTFTADKGPVAYVY